MVVNHTVALRLERVEAVVEASQMFPGHFTRCRWFVARSAGRRSAVGGDESAGRRLDTGTVAVMSAAAFTLVSGTVGVGACVRVSSDGWWSEAALRLAQAFSGLQGDGRLCARFLPSLSPGFSMLLADTRCLLRSISRLSFHPVAARHPFGPCHSLLLHDAGW